MNVIFRHQLCNVCGNDDVRRIGGLFIPEEFTENRLKFSNTSIVRCKYCGFYYIDPMPIDGIDILYNNQYFSDTYTIWWLKTRIEVNLKMRFSVIEKYIKSPRPRFLEVGCGSGYGLQEAKRRNWQIYGQDITDVFAKRIKNGLNIEIHIGKLEQADFSSNFFDVVYLDSVIEHVPQPVVMLNEIKRILKPNGVAYIVTPNADALINRTRNLIFKIFKKIRLQTYLHLSHLII